MGKCPGRVIVMPFINIKIAKGRTLDQKRKLFQAVTEAVSTSIGVVPEKVWIQIDEFEKENFATDGRMMLDKK
jgi:4-oxalocrotonate tautomerase